MAETRKLAAIFCSDVVGFSRLAGADEDRILARLRTLRSDLIDPTIAVHNGRVVKRTGDGSIVEFRSVVDAVRCAIEVQNAMVERNAGVPEDRRIVFRIGIHLGDVVEESDGDLMGDGVNIAARLEGIAEPGAICLSEDAYRQVKGRLDLAVTDLGPTQLKNIAEPIRAYSLQVGVPAVAKPATEPKPPEPKRRSLSRRWLPGSSHSSGSRAEIKYFLAGNRPALRRDRAAPAEAAHLSIVVLPFTNLSNDSAQDYFVDGVTENLTTDLSRIRGSFVIARNTAFAFKGKASTPRRSVRSSACAMCSKARCSAMEPACASTPSSSTPRSGAHLWAERFDEEIADLFKLQDQVVARLANTLGREFEKVEAEKGARSKNPDAVDLVMRGWAVQQKWGQSTGTDIDYNKAARVFFERALEIDPDNADALWADASTYFVQMVFGPTNPDTDYEAKVIGQANHAIAVAPNEAGAYDVKGEYLLLTNRTDQALRVVEAGLAVAPNYPDLYGTRGWADEALGRFAQAKSDEQRALQLSPHDPYQRSWRFFLGEAELGLGHLDAAIDESQKAIDQGERIFQVYRNLAAADALQGKMEEAKTALAEALRLNPKLTLKVANAYHVPNLSEGLRKAGLPEE